MGKLGIVKRAKSEVTAEQLKSRFPTKKNTITDEIVSLVNDANNDPMFNGDEFMESLVTYQSAMIDGSYSIKEYVNALKFVAYLESEDNITEAYKRARANDAFVQDRLELATTDPKYTELTSAASRYRKTPLVRQILTQTDMPLYLMFAGARYDAVNVLVSEMHNAYHSKDKISAAKAVLENIKPPENIQVELDIGVKESSAIEQLNMQLAELAVTQKRHLELGTGDLTKFGAMTVKDQDVIDAEVQDA